MSQDEQPPGGLLSKVVKFVRNPTVNWSDLNQPEGKESHYSKQMLKEMIERKRANDFVRRREFDQLRKLRQRNALGMGGTLDAAGRPSFFQSSLPSEPGDRAGTLQKIDEIEAQMSRHWRRSHDQDPVQTASSPPSDADAGLDAAQHARQYATTVHAELPDAGDARDTDFAATDISPMEPARAEMPMALADDLELDWPTAPVQGVVTEVLAYDPALEEAAIRWANGDMAGAEAALTALLGAGSQAPVQESAWMALFDVYRATDQPGRFKAQVAAFSARLGRVAPQWSASAPPPGRIDLRAPSAADAATDWASPALLDARQVQALQSMLDSRQPTVLHLDWSQLDAMADDALEPLVAQFTAWAQQTITLRSLGGARLDGLLRSRTVSGERMASALWWQLRMVWLRIAGRPDEFDLVALDYCITYEVLPPAWRDANCDFIALDEAPAAPAALPEAGLAAVGALSGVVLGDAGEQLSAFDPEALKASQVVVDCSALVRIDFAAAGSVLNWAVALQAAGCRAQFRALPRLVATFFHVVGVGEHADIVSRRD